MGEAPTQSNQSKAKIPERRFPWAVIVVPVLIMVVAYLTSRDWKGEMEDGSLRRKAEEIVVRGLPGRERAEVTVVTVDKHESSANVSGTAVSTEFSGQKRRHHWHISFYNDRGEVKATDWKITPD